MVPSLLNWITALTGLRNHYTKPDEILNSYHQKRLTPISEELIVDLEVNKDDESEFLKLLQKIALTFAIERELDFESESERSEKIWQLSFLKEIVDSSYSIEEKLKQIANQWARFEYPGEWERFIYYLPNDNLTNKSTEGVYHEALTFLHQNLTT
jgi:hypothetical protein